MDAAARQAGIATNRRLRRKRGLRYSDHTRLNLETDPGHRARGFEVSSCSIHVRWFHRSRRTNPREEEPI